MTVKGTVDADEAFGTVEGGGGTAIFTAHVEGYRLNFAMTENGANGQPNPGTARELSFTRSGNGAEPVGAAANPLGGGGDPIEGTFLSNDLNVVVTRGAQGYSGLLFMRGKEYRMVRKGAATPSAPRTSGGMPAAAAAAAAPAPVSGGLGLVGATGVQERQIAQLLVSSAWCCMSYSGGSTYTGGSYNRTSTERVVFAADGSGAPIVKSQGKEYSRCS